MGEISREYRFRGTAVRMTYGRKVNKIISQKACFSIKSKNLGMIESVLTRDFKTVNIRTDRFSEHKVSRKKQANNPKNRLFGPAGQINLPNLFLHNKSFFPKNECSLCFLMAHNGSLFPH